MAIRIVPHAADKKQAVLDFNQRMKEGGSRWGFYVDPEPDWVPKSEGAPTFREYFLAVEDGIHVRGGYALKPQRWLIKGEPHWVTDWQGPFSEGAINPRYATLGLKMIRDMLTKYPLLFSLGHGGSEEPVVQLVRSLGWSLHETPFCLRVVRPARFLRLNKYLRSNERNVRLLDFLASSGLGWIGLQGLHAALELKSPRTYSCEASVEPRFGAWADALWARAAGEYRCLAVRDSEMMNALIPERGWPSGIRLRVGSGSRTLGWAVVLHKRMQDDARFGQLHVGLVADCFAHPDDAAEVVHVAYEFLVQEGVDMVFSNQSHPAWVAAFEQNGFVILPRRRLFAMAPALKSALEPLSEQLSGLHLTNLDGHGPHGFD